MTFQERYSDKSLLKSQNRLLLYFQATFFSEIAKHNLKRRFWPNLPIFSQSQIIGLGGGDKKCFLAKIRGLPLTPILRPWEGRGSPSVLKNGSDTQVLIGLMFGNIYFFVLYFHNFWLLETFYEALKPKDYQNQRKMNVGNINNKCSSQNFPRCLRIPCYY